MALNNRIIGQRIAEVRKMRRLSQADLAEAANVAVSYISHIETARKSPSLETLVKIADALDVTVDQLLSGNLNCGKEQYLPEVTELMMDCTDRERRLLYDVAMAVKEIVRRNRWLYEEDQDKYKR